MGEETVGPIAEARELRQALPWILRLGWARRFHPAAVAAAAVAVASAVGTGVFALTFTDWFQKERALAETVRRQEAAMARPGESRERDDFTTLVLLVESGRPEAAERLARSASDTKQMASGLLAVASARAKRGDVRRASELTDEALSRRGPVWVHGQDQWWTVTTASVLMEVGRADEALRLARSAPDPVAELLPVAAVCIRTDRKADARRILDEAVAGLKRRSPPYRVFALTRVAGLFGKVGELQSAFELLGEAERTAVSLGDGFAHEIRVRMARELLQMKQTERAAALIARLEPTDRAALLPELGRTFAEVGDRARALSTLKEGAELQRERAGTWERQHNCIALVGVLLRMGEVEAAKHYFNEFSLERAEYARATWSAQEDGSIDPAFGAWLMARALDSSGGLSKDARSRTYVIAAGLLAGDIPLWRSRRLVTDMPAELRRGYAYRTFRDGKEEELLRLYLKRHDPAAYARYRATCSQRWSELI